MLDDLIRNGMIGTISKGTLNMVMGFKLFLTLDAIEYFNNPKPNESSGKSVVQNTYNNCNIQEYRKSQEIILSFKSMNKTILSN